MQYDELVDWIDTPEGAILRADVDAWIKWRPSQLTLAESLRRLLVFPEFLSIVDLRLRNAGRFDPARPTEPHRKRPNDLYIATPDIGGGMLIQHGYSTFVLAERIGVDFHVNQNVTIGMARSGKPTIGDHVRIRTGAVVVGPITIGDNVTITANCVVSQDVPANSTVYPARCVIVPAR